MIYLKQRKTGIIKKGELIMTTTRLKRQTELAKKMKTIQNEMGRPPRKREIEEYQEICELWGSWQTAINDVCGKRNLRKDLTDEDLKEEYWKKRNELGKRLKTTDFDYYYLVILRYGSWSNWLKVVNDEKETSNDKLIQELKDFYTEHQRSPKMEEIKHRSSIIKKIGNGSWDRALAAAGLPPLPPRGLTPTEIITAIQKKAKELKRVPTLREMPEATAAIRTFGSWNNALRVAGITSGTNRYPSRNRTMSNEQILFDLQIMMHRMGHNPMSSEYKHSSLAIKRFGRWSKAIETAKEDPYNTMEKAKKEVDREMKEKEKTGITTQ